MASDVDIANLAISHLGSGAEIANLTTERSQESLACRRFFNIVRDHVLRDFPWPFATKFATLSEIEANPTSEWAFSYRYPSDCLDFRRILSGLRNDSRQSKIPYRIGQDDSGSLIYTDQAAAECEYTVRLTNVLFYPPDFTLAMSYLLAGYIAPRLTGGDPFKRQEACFKLYEIQISNAKASAANEEQPDQPVESEFIRTRDEGVDVNRFSSIFGQE